MFTIVAPLVVGLTFLVAIALFVVVRRTGRTLSDAANRHVDRLESEYVRLQDRLRAVAESGGLGDALGESTLETGPPKDQRVRSRQRRRTKQRRSRK